jgi:hypothetical protein
MKDTRSAEVGWMAEPSEEAVPDVTAPNGGNGRRLLERYSQASTTSTWPLLLFALIVLGAGLGAMAALTRGVTAGAITALVTAVLGVAGTHVGHVAGHELATKQAAAQPPMPSLEQLAQLNTDGKLNDDEFVAAKRKLLG